MEAASAHTHEHHHHADGACDEAPSLLRRIAPGAAILAGLILPVAAVAAFFDAGDADHGGYVCPFRQATGLPCPGCGATRAFFHFANGDWNFVHYNWMWPLVWVVALGWGALLVWRGVRREPLAGPRVTSWYERFSASWGVAIASPFVVLLPAWLVALSNIHYIRVA